MLFFALTACEHAHNYGEWETTKEPSCLEEGTKVRRCACLEQESETIPALGHTFDQKNVGDKYLKSGATEDSPALYYFSCRCGEKGVDTFSVGNALGGNGDGTHVFRNEWTYDDEKHWRSCIDLSCDARTNEAAHTFGEWVVDEASTCTKTGSKHHACVVCGKSVSETIPIDATAHNYSAAWTTDGTNHWHKCQNTGCTSVKDKTSHTFGEWIVDTAATCQKTGTRHHVCTVCNKSVSETIPVNSTAHNYATTWTTDGTNHWHACLNSGCTSVSGKTAHTWNEETICVTCQRFKDKGLKFTKRSDGTYMLSDYTGSASEVIIPSAYNGIAVTSIGAEAFYNCTNLTSITIPSSVVQVGDGAFASCGGLKTVTFAGNSQLVGIGSYAFLDCSSLTSIHFGENSKLTSIGDWAFYRCTGLTSITIPDSVTSIDYRAFCNCTSLTSITIPDSVTSIGIYAFEDCTSLTSISFGENSKLRSIDDDAFYGCTGLTSITIPDSVKNIGNFAFEYCTSLTSIHFGGTKAQWENISKGSSWAYKTPTITVYCTDGTVTEY